MIKKLSVLILSALLLVSLSSCGKKDEPVQKEQPKAEETKVEQQKVEETQAEHPMADETKAEHPSK